MPLYPEQTLRSINYDLSSIVYLKLNVGKLECPIVFVESGHCVLLISEIQDILSYHFCFQCASLCISFLYQLLDVTALTNLIPAKHKSKFKLLSNFNYKLPKLKW